MIYILKLGVDHKIIKVHAYSFFVKRYGIPAQRKDIYFIACFKAITIFPAVSVRVPVVQSVVK